MGKRLVYPSARSVFQGIFAVSSYSEEEEVPSLFLSPPPRGGEASVEPDDSSSDHTKSGSGNGISSPGVSRALSLLESEVEVEVLLFPCEMGINSGTVSESESSLGGSGAFLDFLVLGGTVTFRA